MAFWNQIKRSVGNAAANAEDDLKNKLASKLYGTAQTHTASKQTTSELDRQIEALQNQVANPTPYSYDASRDATARKLESIYRQQAKLASNAVLGKYAAMSGGNLTSGAMTAAAQAGSDVSTKLAEALAARESEAYSRYWDEQNNTYNKLAALLGMKEYEDSRADAQWEKDYNREALDFEKRQYMDQMAATASDDPETYLGSGSDEEKKSAYAYLQDIVSKAGDGYDVFANENTLRVVMRQGGFSEAAIEYAFGQQRELTNAAWEDTSKSNVSALKNWIQYPANIDPGVLGYTTEAWEELDDADKRRAVIMAAVEERNNGNLAYSQVYDIVRADVDERLNELFQENLSDKKFWKEVANIGSDIEAYYEEGGLSKDALNAIRKVVNEKINEEYHLFDAYSNMNSLFLSRKADMETTLEHYGFTDDQINAVKFLINGTIS